MKANMQKNIYISNSDKIIAPYHGVYRNRRISIKVDFHVNLTVHYLSMDEECVHGPA